VSAASASTRIGVWFYRRLHGRAMGGSAEAPVVVLTVPGRRSGLPRSVCVRALRREDGYVVWGSASGRPADPDWFRNLRAAGRAQLREGDRELTVDAVELVGDQRARVWHDIVSVLPRVGTYETKAGRTIPVARLTPLPPG
jgi:deazaflavin-dependent oxidoreductase (nitroreductase family)